MIGKVLAPRSIPHTDLESMFRNIWNPKQSMVWKPLGVNIVIILFAMETDYLCVMKGTSWLFDRFLFAIEKVDTKAIPASFNPSMCPFWVQIHCLPFGFLNMNFAKIGDDHIGGFIEADTNKDRSLLGQFMRIRVNLDLSKPLRKKLKVTQGSVEVECDLMYERLPLFCFFHGRIGPVDKNCDTKLLNSTTMATIFRYSNSLRDPPPQL